MIVFKSFFSSSHGNLHSVSDGKTTIMIDCGLPWKKIQKAFGFKTSMVSAVCLGHEHLDHSKSVKNAARAGIDVYLLPETKKNLGLSGHRFHEINLLKQFKIGSFAVKAFPLQHDVPNCGFLFMSAAGGKAVYLNDTFYCKFVFPPLDIIAIGCNYSLFCLSENLDPYRKRRLLTSHMSLENLIKFLAANNLSKCREIHLLHLSNENSDADMFKQAVQRATGIPTFIAEE